MKKRDEMIAEAKLACMNLDIEGFREVADYCNEMADSLEREAGE
jgi:hypothetical protein